MYAPGRVLVRFKDSPAGAAAAKAQASRPLAGLKLKRLVGKHHARPVGSDHAAALGGGRALRASAPAPSVPSDALMLFEITDGKSVPEKVKELMVSPGECSCASGRCLAGHWFFRVGGSGLVGSWVGSWLLALAQDCGTY